MTGLVADPPFLSRFLHFENFRNRTHIISIDRLLCYTKIYLGSALMIRKWQLSKVDYEELEVAEQHKDS